MRRPETHRAIGITAGLASATVLGVVLASHDPHDGMSLPLLIAIIGVIPSIVYASIAHAAARRYRRLLAGEGVIARWTVSPQLWKDFNVALGRPAPERPDGVDVLIGESSTVVDGDVRYFPVRGDQKVISVRYYDLAVPYLVFEIETTIRHVPSVGNHIVPVALGAGADAVCVVENYTALIAAITEGSRGKR